jgi:hypothetical protein
LLHFMKRWRHPGFMTVTVAVALLATPSFGLLAASLEDSEAVARERVAESEARLREAIIERGWAPIDAGAARGPAALLESRHGIEMMAAARPFRIDAAGGALSGAPPEAKALGTAAEVLVAELTRYPRGFLARSRLRRVLLTRELSENGTAIPSLPNFEGALLLDVDAPAAFLRRLIHHEIFHFFDYAGDDQLKRDPAWERMNDRWFVYGSGGRFVRAPGSARLTAELPGFVSRYATAALEEDKAETFAFMMAAPGPLAAIAERDGVLRAKIHAIRRDLHVFCPEIDGHFWARGGSI